MSIVKWKNLTKVYGKGSAQVTALDNVTLRSQRDSSWPSLGPPVRERARCSISWAVWDRPTSGRVLIDGEDIYAPQ